jgi:hypothetical protein
MDHHIIDLFYQGHDIHITALMREEGHDLVYDCYTGDVMLGTIRPSFGEDPMVIWVGDDMPADLVTLIGQEIERQDA